MPKIYFRLDDVAPNMNWENFNRLAEIFKKYDINPLLAVIPENKDPELFKYPVNPDFWPELKNLIGGGWTLGQHGYRHLYKTNSGGVLKINRKSEFAGLDFETQKSMIAAGRSALKEKIGESDIFIAPGHAFDKNTIRALKEEGFKYLSDGIAFYPFKKWGVVWLPQTMWRPRKILLGLATVALHPNTMNREDLNNLENFIKENRKIIGDFSELTKWRGGLKSPAIFIANLIFKAVWRLLFFTKHGLSR